MLTSKNLKAAHPDQVDFSKDRGREEKTDDPYVMTGDVLQVQIGQGDNDNRNNRDNRENREMRELAEAKQAKHGKKHTPNSGPGGEWKLRVGRDDGENADQAVLDFVDKELGQGGSDVGSGGLVLDIHDVDGGGKLSTKIKGTGAARAVPNMKQSEYAPQRPPGPANSLLEYGDPGALVNCSLYRFIFILLYLQFHA